MSKEKLPFDTYMEVIWDDASSNDGWVSVSGDVDPQRIVTRGWLIKKTKTYVTLASSIYATDAETVGGTQTIPCGMIITSRELKVTNARSKLRSKVHPEPDTKELHREPGKG